MRASQFEDRVKEAMLDWGPLLHPPMLAVNREFGLRVAWAIKVERNDAGVLTYMGRSIIAGMDDRPLTCSKMRLADLNNPDGGPSTFKVQAGISYERLPQIIEPDRLAALTEHALAQIRNLKPGIELPADHLPLVIKESGSRVEISGIPLDKHWQYPGWWELENQGSVQE